MSSVPHYLVGAVAIVITFGLAVFVHEFGHMMFALIRGVGVESFAIGMGPKIVAWHWKGIEFSLRWFPIGGFVKLKGMIKEDPATALPPAQPAQTAGEEPGGVLTMHDVKVDDGQDKQDKSLTEASYDDLLALADKGFLTKLLVFGGGVFMNFLTAIAAMALYLYIPHEELRFETIIEKVEPESKLAQAGFQAGDRIVSVNGSPVTYLDEVLKILTDEAEAKNIDFDEDPLPMNFGVARGNSNINVNLPDSTLVGFSEISIKMPPIIGGVLPHYPADKAGIKPGDRILEINSQPVDSWLAFAEIIKTNLGKPIELVALRGSERNKYHLTPVENIEDFSKGAIGIIPGSEVKHIIREESTVWLAIAHAPAATFAQVVLLAYKQYDFFRRASFKQIRENLGGPIAIADFTQRMAREGFSKSLMWFINLNLLLMIFNLLPIPVLDGGFILLAVIEGISRRPVSPKILQPIYTVFVIFFISLMLIISLLDIKKFFG